MSQEEEDGAPSGGVGGPPMRVERIPVDRIRILNSRSRGATKFRKIVASIDSLGLKRPITVNRREQDSDYDLVCGEGRLQALVALGEKEVPAIVISVSLHDCYIISLVENLVRPRPAVMAAIHEMVRLEAAGNSQVEIARKMGCHATRVSTLLKFFHEGESRLLRAVERGDLPLDVATEIAKTQDKDMQGVLEKAYKSGQLRGKALGRVRKLVDQRRRQGKSNDDSGGAARADKKTKSAPQTAESLLRVYKRETQRQRLLVKKAGLCDARLTFMVGALRSLVGDAEFVAILRAEDLATMPKWMAERMGGVL